MSRTARTRAAGLLLAGLVLSGCGLAGRQPVATSTAAADGLHGTQVGDVIARPALTLQDTSGRPYALQQRPADELTVLYFGYTRCPDVCPTTLAELAAARRQLTDAERARLQVVFVTEDPATDTGPVVRRYLDAFDPSFVGLVGGDPVAEQALDDLRAPRTKIVPTAPAGVQAPATGSTVQHASSVYAFSGARTVVYTDQTSPSDYAADFRQLLHGSRAG